MDKHELIYTPERGIPMTEPQISDDGSVLLIFKKAGEDVYEPVRLEFFLGQVYSAIERSKMQAVEVRQPRRPKQQVARARQPR